MSELKLAELIGSLSYALDLTEGQPEGHCVRCCWIGMHIGREIGLDDDSLWSLYYTLLLKDLGCSSNAARICQLYLTDDRSFKRDFKQVGTSTAQVLGFVLSHTGADTPWRQRLQALTHIVRNGDAVAQELIQTRCTRGADIARRLRFPESVAEAVHGLDEHFDGSGRPERRAGDAIPLGSRIALIAQIIDVFHFSHGRTAALAEVQRRRGTWFDPALVAAFEQVALREDFWQTLGSSDVEQAVLALEPSSSAVPLDEDYLDAIAAAFGEVVDAKSPFTAGHSERVGFYTDRVAEQLGVPVARRRWLRRAAMLHDVGKLGVSNTILDKPGRLDEDEWARVRQHTLFTEQILSRISAFSELARVAASHHEKLDGTGYPHGLSGNEISLETRIITVADIFDAITAERPYHAATPVERTLQIMAGHVGTAVDPDCFEALCVVARAP
ncbi:MAG: Response regulator [uncultured Lysobacter sp.]|uniref:Response regulator n=1 Tax=uncultured Lysobacter sp. TaxID=271060 RepID=A0A6J4LLM2_9GAMM|nr:MAG: Response regulator [uncultured Lysobacter sp.]